MLGTLGHLQGNTITICAHTHTHTHTCVYVSTTVFIKLSNYVGHMFRLSNSHLQAYSLQVKSQAASGLFFIYRVSQEECARLREGVPYVKVYQYNPKHLCPKLNGYGDNGQRSLKL